MNSKTIKIIKIFFFFSEIGVVDELVEKNGLSVLSARDEWGYTPAHWAALDGNIEVSFFLMK